MAAGAPRRILPSRESRTLRSRPGVQRRRLEGALRPHEQIAAPLGRVLLLAAEMNVEVVSITSNKGQTEEAFIHSLEVEQADGFSRA